jgi:hypothetical protein
VVKKAGAKEEVEGLLHVGRGLAGDDIALKGDHIEVAGVGSSTGLLDGLLELLRLLETMVPVDRVDRTWRKRALGGACARLLLGRGLLDLRDAERELDTIFLADEVLLHTRGDVEGLVGHDDDGEDLSGSVAAIGSEASRREV